MEITKIIIYIDCYTYSSVIIVHSQVLKTKKHFMETSKKFFNIALGISLIVCSFSLLIYSTKSNKATAQTPATLPNGMIVAGPVFVVSGMSGNCFIMGYNPKDGQVSVLGKIAYKDMKE